MFAPVDEKSTAVQPTLFTEDEAEEYVRRCREELRTTAMLRSTSIPNITTDIIHYRNEVAKAIQEILKDLVDPCCIPLSVSSPNTSYIDEMCTLLQQQSVVRDPRQPFFNYPPDVPYRIPMIQWLQNLPALSTKMLGGDGTRRSLRYHEAQVRSMVKDVQGILRSLEMELRGIQTHDAPEYTDTTRQHLDEAMKALFEQSVPPSVVAEECVAVGLYTLEMKGNPWKKDNPEHSDPELQSV
eukprot:PhF_6_TR25823/c1_g2_i5/m.36462